MTLSLALPLWFLAVPYSLLSMASHCGSWSVSQFVCLFLEFLLGSLSHHPAKNFLVEFYSLWFEVGIRLEGLLHRHIRFTAWLVRLCILILHALEHFQVFFDPWVKFVRGFQRRLAQCLLSLMLHLLCMFDVC